MFVSLSVVSQQDYHVFSYRILRKIKNIEFFLLQYYIKMRSFWNGIYSCKQHQTGFNARLVWTWTVGFFEVSQFFNGKSDATIRIVWNFPGESCENFSASHGRYAAEHCNREFIMIMRCTYFLFISYIRMSGSFKCLIWSVSWSLISSNLPIYWSFQHYVRPSAITEYTFVRPMKCAL